MYDRILTETVGIPSFEVAVKRYLAWKKSNNPNE